MVVGFWLLISSEEQSLSNIEGRNPVLEALRSGRPISKILLAKNIERHGNIADIIHLAQTGGVLIEYVDRLAIDRQSETRSHQGVLAVTSTKEYADLDELLEIPKAKNEVPFLVVLDGIEDPHNLGAILRTADACGVQGVITRERRAAGLTSAVEKSSAGAVEYIPVARVVNISQTIRCLKENNIWIVGINQSGKTSYTQIDYRMPLAIVIGGEGGGLSDLVKKNCDFLASIPMKGRIASLNASVAAAVIMYEVLRQRNQKK
jgi:23S rRNA (guanosine2251-2'-O)-methyltransferase